MSGPVVPLPFRRRFGDFRSCVGILALLLPLIGVGGRAADLHPGQLDPSFVVRDLAANEQVQQIPWLLTRFVQQTSGVTDAVCVSSDGLLMAMSTDLDRGRADQFAAIAAGLTSLSLGASRCFGYGDVDQVMVEMSTGFLFVASISDGSCLGILADKSADVGLVGYEMTMLVDRFGAVLTPQVRAGLRSALAAA